MLALPRRRLVLVLLCVYLAMGFADLLQLWLTLLGEPRPLDGYAMFRSTVPAWLIKFALLPVVLWLARAFPFERGRWKGALAVHVLAAVGHALVFLGLAGWVCDIVLAPGPQPFTFGENFQRLIRTYVVVELAYYGAVVAIHNAVFYHSRYRDRDLEATRLALEASRLSESLLGARLSALQLQMRPHFLFNALNAISSMAASGSTREVTRMISALGNLLRRSLERPSDNVPLEQEIELVRDYLAIELLRFSDRLEVEINIDPSIADAQVPSFLLQPLVENAVQYGIAAVSRPGKITIVGRPRGGYVELSVRDTGPGFPPVIRKTGTGIGLGNTRARLEQIYGPNFRFELSNHPEGGARVAIAVPYRSVAPRREDRELVSMAS